MTPEREEELINRIARYIDDSEIRDFAKVLLRTFGFTEFFGTLGFITVYPFVTALAGPTGQEVVELLGLNAVESSKRILERVDELANARRGEESGLDAGSNDDREVPPDGAVRSIRSRLAALFSKRKRAAD